MNNSQKKEINLIWVHHYLICHWLSLFYLFYFRLLNSTRVLPSGYTTGYLQRCFLWVVYRDVYSLSHYQYFLENRSVIWTVLGVLLDLNFFGVVLKCLEDTSKEACDADGVYVVLQNQRWGESFENRWAVWNPA